MESGSRALGRRRFISAAAGVAATTLTRRSKASSPNDKIVLALIGCGGRGSQVIQSISKLPGLEVGVLCDPELKRAEALVPSFQKSLGYTPKVVQDLRRVLDDKHVDAVMISTPEQWHAPATVMACQAGKDVYVEKNCSLSIWEGRKMVEAARKYKRIVQVGTQNRSAPYNMAARDYIRSGKLGKILLVKVFNMLPGGRWTPSPDSNPPDRFDWDLWLGPAPKRPYNPGHHRSWGDYWAYCGGTLSGDGSHQLDLARMVLGDPPHPKTIAFTGGRFLFDDHREMPDTMVISYQFDDMVMTMENTTFTSYMDKIAPDIRESDDLHPFWPQCATRIEIYGTDALMYLGRHGGGWQVYGKAKTQSRPSDLIAHMKGRFPDPWHQRNFLECIRSRSKPTADIEEAHKSACLVHFGNVAYRAKRNHLDFDGSSESFVNDREANRFLKPHYRAGFTVPESM